MDRWFSTSWGLLCFHSVQMSSLMVIKFSCFFEICFLGVILIDAVSNTILLETSHEDIWHWLLNLPIPIQSARLWRELSINVNKSYQSFPRVRTNQSQPLMALNNFDNQLLLLGVMIYVQLRLLIFVPPRYANNLELIIVFFPKFWCLAEFQFEVILWIVVFQLLEDFFVSNQWKGLRSWISSFRVSLWSVS